MGFEILDERGRMWRRKLRMKGRRGEGGFI